MIPNVVTMARLLAAPVAVWLIAENMLVAAFWLFVTAAATDIVDGYLAKRLNAHTALGSYLDPLADKALLISVYVMLGYRDHMVNWLVILVVFRDVAIIGGVVLYKMLVGELTIRPLLLSKLNTLTQVLLAALVLGGLGFRVDVGGLVSPFVFVVAATALVSGAAYATILGRAAFDSGSGGR